MKFTVNAKEVLAAINKSFLARDNNPARIVLLGVMIDASESAVSLTCGNGAVYVCSTCHAEVEDMGNALVPANTLRDILAAVSGGRVIVELQPNGQVSVKCGRSRYDINTIPCEEWPKHPDMEKIEGKIELYPESLEALRSVSFAVSDNDMRMALTGVNIQATSRGLADFVATDGYVLALNNAPSGIEEDCAILIPRRSVGMLLKIMGKDESATVTWDVSTIRIDMPGAFVISKRIAAKYPNYKQIVKASISASASFSKEDMSGAIRRVSLAMNSFMGLDFSFDGEQCSIFSENVETGKAHETVDATLQGLDSMKTIINQRFIKDAVGRVTGDKVIMGWDSSDTMNRCHIYSVDGAGPRFIIVPMLR